MDLYVKRIYKQPISYSHEKMLNVDKHLGNTKQNNTKMFFLKKLLISIGPDVQTMETSHITGRTLKSYSHFQNQFGSS